MTKLQVPSGTIVIVGRHPSCDWQIDDLTVSRVHMAMVLCNGTVFVRDLQSFNGIYVGGYKEESCLLEEGDELTCGAAEIHWRIVGTDLVLERLE